MARKYVVEWTSVDSPFDGFVLVDKKWARILKPLFFSSKKAANVAARKEFLDSNMPVLTRVREVSNLEFETVRTLHNKLIRIRRVKFHSRRRHFSDNRRNRTK